MAEPPVVGALIETFTSMLADKVLEEVSLITGFKNDFEFLCDELVSVKLLLDEVGQNSTSRSMSNWLEKLEYFLIDAVDIVDECRTNKFGKSIFSNFEKLIFRYKMGSRIRTLKERINNIHGSAKYLKHLMSVLQVNALNAHNLEDKRERFSALLKESVHIVGIEENINKLTKFILNEKGPQVIAVVGMGGMGKTFLVDCVVKSQKVQENFDHVVWLEVPQNFDMKDMSRRIKKKMKLLCDQDENDKIIEELQRSRCLFVLDDIWKKDDFNQFHWLLGKTKIVVTTRDKGVMSTISPDHEPKVYELEKLSSKNSKKLFCIHAFPDRGDTQQSPAYTNEPPKEITQHSTASTDIQPPKELRNVTDEIVLKCGGLPLALKTIGASMARVRRLPNDWESILKSLNEAEAMSGKVWASLRLSYDTLPYHLKLCFDYCSCFPKNGRIKSEYLVNAWIDEGFIPQTAEYPYDVGFSYINELIDRCLLEVSKVGGDGRVKYCKMHDLLHDLAHAESHKKTKCLLNPAKELKEFPACESRLRRISLIENNIPIIDEPIKCPGIRTLLLCNNLSLVSIKAIFFADMKYLAVLDLSCTSIDSLPDTVGNLKHLKFLNLSQTKITKLPRSLAELRSLQFMDVSQCEHLREMHSGIGEHKSMLHLNVKGSGKLESLPVGISKLIYLHTLKGPVFKREREPTANALQLCALVKREKAVNAKVLQFGDLKRLTLLQHLSLTLNAPSSNGIFQLEEGIFGSLTNMRALSIKYIDSSEDASGSLCFPEEIQFMRRLEILHLKNCALQDWIFELENLMELELYGDNGSTSVYRGLANIPNLRKLKLSTNDNDKCVEFPQEFGKSGAFPKLENFVIKRFNKMENFPSLQDGALPMLKCLQMKHCDRLKDITKALQRPSSLLEEIRVKGCPVWQNGIWTDKGTWKFLKDHPIKLTIDGYTISWDLDQYDNSKLFRNDLPRKVLRSSMLIYQIAFRFKEVGTSSAGGVAVDRTLQNVSSVECRQQQITMDEHKEESVAGVTGMTKGEPVSSSNSDEIPNQGNFQAQTETLAHA